MSMIVRVIGQRLFHELENASICQSSLMNIIVQVFGQGLFHEHESASIWSEVL